MKIMITAMVLFLTGNALAQPGYSFQADDQTALPTVDECLADLNECREKLGDQTGDSMDLLLRLAERTGFASIDDMLISDCRSRRGTWSNGECTCTSPNSWFTEESEECCVSSVARYERRMRACRESGGNWTCRGECRCPNEGQQLADGVCVGDATSREEIQRMRNRIPELEADVARVQGELETARAQGGAQADQISDLEDQLTAARDALDELRDLLALREQQLRDALGTVPAPLPGTAEAIAAAAGGSEPGPLGPTPPPEAEEGEETCWAWDRECPWILIGSLVSAGGLGVGIWAATRDIDIQQE